jgi:hypothetical protein
LFNSNKRSEINEHQGIVSNQSVSADEIPTIPTGDSIGTNNEKAHIDTEIQSPVFPQHTETSPRSSDGKVDPEVAKITKKKQVKIDIQPKQLTVLTEDLLVDAYNVSKLRLKMSKLHIMQEYKHKQDTIYEAMSAELTSTFEALSQEIFMN